MSRLGSDTVDKVEGGWTQRSRRPRLWEVELHSLLEFPHDSLCALLRFPNPYHRFLFLCPISKIDPPSGPPPHPDWFPQHSPCEHAYLSSLCVRSGPTCRCGSTLRVGHPDTVEACEERHPGAGHAGETCELREPCSGPRVLVTGSGSRIGNSGPILCSQ